jgi:hypothetical protein
MRTFLYQLLVVLLASVTFITPLAQATDWEQTNRDRMKVLGDEAKNYQMSYTHYEEAVNRFKAHVLVKRDDGSLNKVMIDVKNHQERWHSTNVAKNAALQASRNYILQYGVYNWLMWIARSEENVRKPDTTTRVGLNSISSLNLQLISMSYGHLMEVNLPAASCTGIGMALASIVVIAGIFAIVPGGQPAAAVSLVFGGIIGLSAKMFCP